MKVSKAIRVVLAISIPTMLGGALAGAASAQDASPAAKEPVVFVEGTLADVTWVNPFRAISVAEYGVLAWNYDLLLNFDKATLGAAAGIADEWSKSEDGLTWTFHIRDGATWQDGEPVTAHDVAFTYNLVVDNQIGALLNYFPFTDSFEAPDDSTFIWKTTEPTVAPEYPPWVYILPEHIWGDLGPREVNRLNEVPVVGSGPFQMTEWDKGRSWSFEANPDYWAGAPAIDQYVVKLYNNEEAMVNALRNGEIDYSAGITPDLFNVIKNEPGITGNIGPAAEFDQMTMNVCGNWDECKPVGTGHPALLDQDVRTAIAMSIDKEALVDKVLRGYGLPGTTVVPPNSKYWHWDPGEATIPFDIEGANALLDQAGYVDADDDGVREMPGGGQPLEMRFVIENEEPNRVTASRFVVGWLKQIGIKTSPQPVTYNKMVSVWLDNDFDLYMWGWGPDPDPDFILSTFTASQCGVWSDTCYTNEEYEQLYQDQRSATSKPERQDIVYRMQEIVYNELPEVVLYYGYRLEAYRSDRWTGFVQSPEPRGFILAQYTPFSLQTIKPVSATAQLERGGGGSAAVWIAIGTAVVVVVGLVALMRRRGSDEERA